MTRSLMQTQLATLFRLDQRGRMLCVNEPGDPPAPRLFMGRTAMGAIWAFRHDLPDDLCATLDSICAAEPIAATFEAPPQYAPVLRSLLGLGAAEWRGPAYVFPERFQRDTGAVQITPAQFGALTTNFPFLVSEYEQSSPVAAQIEQGTAVTACWCSRRTVVAAEAGIESIPAVRGRGYAVQAAAVWAAAVQASGRIALYSTSWENKASQAVARKLGLYLYGEDWEII